MMFRVGPFFKLKKDPNLKCHMFSRDAARAS